MKNKKIYFIGIGGIGVSALAKYYLCQGFKVSGSDLAPSEITKALFKMGVALKIGPHRAKNLPKGVDAVIFSPAVRINNPEYREALKRKVELKSYPQALGELTKNHFTIAVSGTHGKSTTTALLGILLKSAGLDPSVIIGTKVKEFNNSNCLVGKSKYLAIEADEHFASFLNYWPQIIVLTTVEREHLDFYKNLNSIIKTYKKYINHLPEGGILVANKDDQNIKKIIKSFSGKIVYYSQKDKDAKKIQKVLKVPGRHNIANALAVKRVGEILKIPEKTILSSLAKYQGAWRRFEVKETKISGKRITLVSDYGHHPTEVKATVEGAREKYKNKKIWLVFQPHQYQRTYFVWSAGE